jgi:hypothetical protein
MEQLIEDSIEKFEGLLSRKNIQSGNSYQKAKLLYEGKQKNKIIKENLPKAWQKIVSEPDEKLVELLNETLEKISGFKAENNQITDFLQAVFPTFSIGTLTVKQPVKSPITTVQTEKKRLSSAKNLKSVDMPVAQTGSQIYQDAIHLNPDELEDLSHTKVLEARFADKICANSWRNIVDIELKAAFEKNFLLSDIQNKLNINIKEGIHKNQGFHPIENLNYSWQNRDTNRTIKYVIKLAKLLGAEIYVLFEWGEKGKFPMKKGVINWKP